MADDPQVIKFRCLVNNEKEDVLAYNDIINYIEDDESWDGLDKLDEILEHSPVIRNTKKNRE